MGHRYCRQPRDSPLIGRRYCNAAEWQAARVWPSSPTCKRANMASFCTLRSSLFALRNALTLSWQLVSGRQRCGGCAGRDVTRLGRRRLRACDVMSGPHWLSPSPDCHREPLGLLGQVFSVSRNERADHGSDTMESNDTWRGALMRDLGLGIARTRANAGNALQAIASHRSPGGAGHLRSERLFQFLPTGDGRGRGAREGQIPGPGGPGALER